MVDQWKSTDPFFLKGEGWRQQFCMLLIHGFTGNPGDCRRLGSYLHSQGYSVQAIRLPGHGTTPEEMRETRWEDWWKHTVDSYDQLADAAPGRIIVPVGYSMGGLLALKLSLVRPIAGVVTLAAPIFLRDRRIRFAGLVKHIKPYIHKQPAMSDYLVVERGAYAKTPLACVESLYKQLRIVRRQLSEVKVPLFIGQGTADLTVRPKSAEYIHKRASSPWKILKYYPDVSHAIMADVRREEVFADILGFMNRLHTSIGDRWYCEPSMG